MGGREGADHAELIDRTCDEVLVAHLAVEVGAKRGAGVAPERQFASPEQRTAEDRIHRPRAVPAGVALTAIPGGHRQANIAGISDYVHEARAGPHPVEVGDPCHVARCLVADQRLATTLCVHVDDQRGKPLVAHRFGFFEDFQKLCLGDAHLAELRDRQQLSHELLGRSPSRITSVRRRKSQPSQ
jgi:hypothetical protein